MTLQSEFPISEVPSKNEIRIYFARVGTTHRENVGYQFHP